MDDIRPRCGWCNLSNPVYVAYHDAEWAVPSHDDHHLFEMLVLETFQAGLSWETILNKRKRFRQAFDGFDIERIRRYDENKIAELMNDPGIIRNRRKIVATVGNANAFRDIQTSYGSFDDYEVDGILDFRELLDQPRPLAGEHLLAFGDARLVEERKGRE